MAKPYLRILKRFFAGTSDTGGAKPEWGPTLRVMRNGEPHAALTAFFIFVCLKQTQNIVNKRLAGPSAGLLKPKSVSCGVFRRVLTDAAGQAYAGSICSKPGRDPYKPLRTLTGRLQSTLSGLVWRLCFGYYGT